ncbi:MAG: thiamine diphosphokinase [Acidaminobacteraceae bacterium]
MLNSIIIANGEIKDYKKTKIIIDNIMTSGAIIIAADGGSNHLDALGVTPNYIVGDLDSSNSLDELKSKFRGCEFELYNSEKDYTDMELAINLAVSLSSPLVYLIGCLGNRLDHTLGNLFLLKTIKFKGLRGVILNETNHVEYISNEIAEIDFDGYKYFSFIPVEGDIKSVTLKGMKYPLDDMFVEFGSTLGISNELVGKKASIELRDSSAIIIKSND